MWSKNIICVSNTIFLHLTICLRQFQFPYIRIEVKWIMAFNLIHIYIYLYLTREIVFPYITFVRLSGKLLSWSETIYFFSHTEILYILLFIFSSKIKRFFFIDCKLVSQRCNMFLDIILYRLAINITKDKTKIRKKTQILVSIVSQHIKNQIG